MSPLVPRRPRRLLQSAPAQALPLLRSPVFRTAAVASLLASASGASWAQVPAVAPLATLPNAGQLLEQTLTPTPAPRSTDQVLPSSAPPPALAPQGGLRVRVTAVRVTGSQAFPEAELARLVDDLPGGDRSLDDLQSAVERVTRHYRAHGYMLARAYLPAQDLAAGQVEIRVLEGRLGAVRLDNTSRQSDGFVRQQLDALQPGQPVQARPLERSLLLLADTPGLDVRSSLRPGASVGTSDLDIAVRDAARVNGDLSLDNHGSRATGQARLGGGITVNDPFGLGDALQLRGLSGGGGLNFARAAYQVPVGASGTRLGASYSALDYRLGKEFDVLEAHGTARIASVFLTHPFVRSRAANLSGQIVYEQKRLDDRIDLTSTASRRRLNNVTLGLSGDRVDATPGGGVTQGSLGLTFGKLSLDGTDTALDAQGLRSQGHFAKANLWLRRLQPLSERLQLHAQFSAQATNRNLDSAEKMALGGVYGVRAYPQGEAPSDDAWLANLELRYSVAAAWQALLFYDAASGRLSHDPVAGAAPGTNHRKLSGGGFGVRWSHPQGYSLLTTVAWRTSGAPTAERDRSPRLWLQLGKSF